MLTKKRARKMLEVLLTLRPFEEGNHRIELKDGKFIFSYRGTPIVAYDLRTKERVELHAGVYEDTMSTQAQRKVIFEAIDQFESCGVDHDSFREKDLMKAM